MPADMKYRNNSAINLKNVYGGDRLYSRSSTAYELPAYYPGEAPKPAPRKKPAPVHKSSAAAKRSMRRLATIGVLVFAAAMVILCRYVSILNGNHTIGELEAKYKDIVSSNQAMRAKIDGRLEKGEIEKLAREELGMMAPESYQVFYIEMDMPDGGNENGGDKDGKNAVMGTPGTLMRAFKVLK